MPLWPKPTILLMIGIRIAGGWFIAEVLGKLEKSIDMEYRSPTVHAELAMIIEMAKGEIDVLPYISISKLSCTMCSHYIDAYNEVWKRKIVTKGSRVTGRLTLGGSGLAFPSVTKNFVGPFLRRVRRQLLSEEYTERWLSDSSVGSQAGAPQLEKSRTDDDVIDLVATAKAAEPW